MSDFWKVKHYGSGIKLNCSPWIASVFPDVILNSVRGWCHRGLWGGIGGEGVDRRGGGGWRHRVTHSHGARSLRFQGRLVCPLPSRFLERVGGELRCSGGAHSVIRMSGIDLLTRVREEIHQDKIKASFRFAEGPIFQFILLTAQFKDYFPYCVFSFFVVFCLFLSFLSILNRLASLFDV